MGDRHGFTEAEKIRVGEIDSRAVRPAGTRKGHAGTQCPDIFCDNPDSNLAVGIFDRHHARIVEITQRSQIAFGFREDAPLVFVARMKQQLRADRRLSGAYVQLVGKVIQAAIFARIMLIEYLAHIQFNLADDCALRLQGLIAGNVSRTRLLNGGALGGSEFGRLGSVCAQHREHDQASVAAKDAPDRASAHGAFPRHRIFAGLSSALKSTVSIHLHPRDVTADAPSLIADSSLLHVESLTYKACLIANNSQVGQRCARV